MKEQSKERRMFGLMSFSPVRSVGGKYMDTSWAEDLVNRVHTLEENVGALTGSTAMTDGRVQDLLNSVQDLGNDLGLCLKEMKNMRLEMEKISRDVLAARRRQ